MKLKTIRVAHIPSIGFILVVIFYLRYELTARVACPCE